MLEFHSSPHLCFPGTVLARCLVFPLIVKGQREAAKIHNHLPEIQKFSTRIREAKLTGNHTECESVKNERGRGPELPFPCHSAKGEGQPKSGVATVEQVLKIHLFLRPDASGDWPGSVRNLTGHVMRMVTSTSIAVSPAINLHSLYSLQGLLGNDVLPEKA